MFIQPRSANENVIETYQHDRLNFKEAILLNSLLWEVASFLRRASPCIERRMNNKHRNVLSHLSIDHVSESNDYDNTTSRSSDLSPALRKKVVTDVRFVFLSDRFPRRTLYPRTQSKNFFLHNLGRVVFSVLFWQTILIPFLDHYRSFHYCCSRALRNAAHISVRNESSKPCDHTCRYGHQV